MSKKHLGGHNPHAGKRAEEVYPLQSVIDAIPIPIFYKDAHGVYVGCNNAFVRFVGMSRQKIIGKTVYDLLPRQSADIQTIKEQDLLRKGGFQSYESRIPFGDTTLHNVVVYREVLTDPRGKMKGVAGVIFDVTERKKLEEELKECNAELDIRVKVRTAELSKANDDLLKKITEYQRREEKINALSHNTRRRITAIIHNFARMVSERDSYSTDAVAAGTRHAVAIAACMGLSRDKVSTIRQGMLLRDIGKTAIPERILLKKSTLTAREISLVLKHPQIGADIIRSVPLLSYLIPGIFHHHERWDGRGYPTGALAEEIPVEARIIGLLDTYQALVNDRSYRKALPAAKAVKVIKSGAGTRFDPRVVHAFLEVIGT
ncbi:MAG: PAS domain S-box protein [Candidatus Omnitrophica bacterium]|nr:PAS domain S-box protein [Candidatus Omnitrophota bacterium]